MKRCPSQFIAYLFICTHISLFALLASGFTINAAVGKLVESDITLNVGESWSYEADSSQHWSNIELRCKILGKNSETQSGWNLLLYSSDNATCLAMISVTSLPSLLDEEFSEPKLEIRAEYISAKSSLITSSSFKSEVFNKKYNGKTLSLALNQIGDGNFEIWCGDKQLTNLGVVEIDSEIGKIEVQATAKVALQSVNIKSKNKPIVDKYDIDEQRLLSYFNSSYDSNEGIYEYLDSDINTTQSRLGGFYRIAIIKNDVGGYDVIYLSGAQENSRNWSAGMVKGKLSPTIFQNHYNLTWIDSEMEDDMTELSAELDGTMLVAHFPKERAIIRFSRVKF